MKYDKLIEALVHSGAYRATKYHSEKLVAKATRVRYGKAGKKHFNRRVFEIALTMGPPNYAERAFIKACKKAGEPLPVRKILLAGVPV